MTLRLLIDEDSQGRALVAKLKKHGHDVITVSEAGLSGDIDVRVFQMAQEQERTILTRNYRHFLALAEEHKGKHFGILLVYQQNDPSCDMNADDIVRAIENVERTGLELQDKTIVLNHYRY